MDHQPEGGEVSDVLERFKMALCEAGYPEAAERAAINSAGFCASAGAPSEVRWRAAHLAGDASGCLACCSRPRALFDIRTRCDVYPTTDLIEDCGVER